MKRFIFKRLEKLATKDVNNFTTCLGLTIRRIMHKPISIVFGLVLRIIYKQKVIVDRKIKLEKHKSYVFASNHSFYFDGPAVIATVDRNFYSLFGATEQLHVEIRTLFIWLNGLIYVDRFDKQSRKDSVIKMNKVLQAGNSILIFPEGRWNDSENLLCQKLFAGPYNLSVQNQVEVVPVSVYNDEKNHIYVSYGEPLKLYEYDTKDKGIEVLRDSLATLYYEQIEKHSEFFKREDIKGDIHIHYMDSRMKEYSKAHFPSNYCWDDELFDYKAEDIDLEDVWQDIDKVNINIKNIDKFKDILQELAIRKKYNFKDYMNENYKKKY